MPGSPRRRPRTTIIMMVLLSFTVITIGSKDVPVLGSVRGAHLEIGFDGFLADTDGAWTDRPASEQRVVRVAGKQVRCGFRGLAIRGRQDDLPQNVADIPTRGDKVPGEPV